MENNSFIQTLTLFRQGFKTDLGNVISCYAAVEVGNRAPKGGWSLLPGESGVSEVAVLELGVGEAAGPLGDPAGGPVAGIGGTQPSIRNRRRERVLLFAELLVQ